MERMRSLVGGKTTSSLPSSCISLRYVAPKPETKITGAFPQSQPSSAKEGTTQDAIIKETRIIEITVLNLLFISSPAYIIVSYILF
jgi:hypothetical protein